MNAPELMHPSEETLAAFMEGRLEQVARKQVLQHLDMEDCGECREVLLLVAEVDEPISISERQWIPLAAAAAVVVLLIVFWPRPRSEVQRITKATEGLQFRISEARLSVDDPYRPKAAVMRGRPQNETEAASNLQFLKAARRLEERSRGDAIDRLQAMAAVHLYLGEPDAALQSLEEALKHPDAEKLAPKRKAALLNDLAVARFQSSGDKRRLIAALDAIERARALDDVSPSIAWTRAVLLSTAQQKNAALQAWQDYLRLDPASAWAAEAQRHVATLQGSASPQ